MSSTAVSSSDQLGPASSSSSGYRNDILPQRQTPLSRTDDGTITKSRAAASSYQIQKDPPQTAATREEQQADENDDTDHGILAEDEHLSRLSILGLCLPAAAVQVGWTVGESLLIPYLLSLGVTNTVANFAWLINPLFGLFLQPLCGHASDVRAINNHTHRSSDIQYIFLVRPLTTSRCRSHAVMYPLSLIFY